MWKKISILLCVLIVILSALYGYNLYDLYKIKEVNKVYDFLLTHIIVTDVEKIPIEKIVNVVENGEDSKEAEDIRRDFISIIKKTFDYDLQDDKIYIFFHQGLAFNFTYNDISFWYDYNTDGTINMYAYVRKFGYCYSLKFVNDIIKKEKRVDIKDTTPKALRWTE